MKYDVYRKPFVVQARLKGRHLVRDSDQRALTRRTLIFFKCCCGLQDGKLHY